MKQMSQIFFAALTVSLFAAASANACYKHTFDRCDASIQVSEAATSGQTAQAPKPRSATAQGSGWVTTVTVNR